MQVLMHHVEPSSIAVHYWLFGRTLLAAPLKSTLRSAPSRIICVAKLVKPPCHEARRSWQKKEARCEGGSLGP